MLRAQAIVVRVAVVILTCVSLVLTGMSSASAQRWGYVDPAHDARKVVNVLSTTLDNNLKGKYRIRVQGREFIKDQTDVIRIFLDTARSNSGPEYRVTWYFGKNPAYRVGTTFLTRADSWDSTGKTVKCPGIGKLVAFGKDQITLSIPKRCVKSPKAVRWSGFVGRITDTRKGSLYGYWDSFPRKNAFKSEWVA